MVLESVLAGILNRTLSAYVSQIEELLVSARPLTALRSRLAPSAACRQPPAPPRPASSFAAHRDSFTPRVAAQSLNRSTISTPVSSMSESGRATSSCATCDSRRKRSTSSGYRSMCKRAI